MHGHSFDAHLPCRGDDAAGDLPAIGDQDLLEGLLLEVYRVGVIDTGCRGEATPAEGNL